MRTVVLRPLVAAILGLSLLGGCFLEAESCKESVGGCKGGRGNKLSPAEKYQQLIDFCNNYPDRPVCKENNLGQ